MKIILIALIFFSLPSFSQDDLSSFSEIEIEKFEYSKAKLQSALAKNDSVDIAEHYYRLGKLLSFNNQISISTIYFNRALTYLNTQPPSFEKGRLNWRIATNEGLLGNEKVALEMFKNWF